MQIISPMKYLRYMQISDTAESAAEFADRFFKAVDLFPLGNIH